MYTANSRNQYDHKDSLELGQRSEALFATLAKKYGWEISVASASENIDGHIDYEISQGTTKYKVDVKSMKRISRSDSNLQEEIIWVELKNVRNTKGWLFGNADLIAFERKNGFRIVKRKDLVKVVNRLVDFMAKVKDASQALYKMYSRANRPDQITQIKMSDLDEIIWGEWQK